ncbi:UdgX family uracil-DNA binding protein [Hydrocarboniphaga sp.]|uniref:UdgX family uracil-DNA binding protein n=1 Tax=Hydrocarboniphaga sp. TaxID=2033016 RepID=UPI002AB983D9|nr:UdgX family uracil-DNA binding protein [Hydrocarboniphaga sp.]MDZ4078782.1 UdgX family uracil-DNA binding protein [Hydrocarboniphaga sp.]
MSASQTFVVARLDDGADFVQWRARARELLQARIEPERVSWRVGNDGGDLFTEPSSPEAPLQATAVPSVNVPKDFLSLAYNVLAHRDPQRHALLYRLLWRLAHGEPRLLDIITDDDVVRARAWAKSVGRDLHKMKAFVRFREVQRENEEPVFVSWFEPEHDIVKLVAPFFMRRFSGMHWSILTPDRSAHWDGETLRFDRGASRSDAPDGDALEQLWRQYYRSIFNPSRLKVTAMKSEMPMKYWKNLPEAVLIPELIREAQPRMQAMVAAAPTTPRKRVSRRVDTPDEALPHGSLRELRKQAHDCRRCELWKPATQTVFGEGPSDARIMLIGEQPGDQEDLAGKPFVGPAGRMLGQALVEIGLDRKQLYVTNTVKHFKFEPRGKFRLHKRADSREQHACRVWLDAELEKLQPETIVCLGSMAASAILGSSFKLLEQRGQWHELGDGRRAFATVHPSYLLRVPGEQERAQAYRDFVRDLRLLTAASP